MLERIMNPGEKQEFPIPPQFRTKDAWSQPLTSEIIPECTRTMGKGQQKTRSQFRLSADGAESPLERDRRSANVLAEYP
jgi:hypothetical protein